MTDELWIWKYTNSITACLYTDRLGIDYMIEDQFWVQSSILS